MENGKWKMENGKWKIKDKKEIYILLPAKTNRLD